MNRRHWAPALALLAIGFFGSYVLYTERLVREIRTEATHHTRMYAAVQRGLLSLERGAELRALLSVQEAVTELGVPVVVLDPDGRPSAVVNLPFETDLTDAADRRRVLEFVRDLDARNEPIVEPDLGTIHFGSPPVLRWLRWIPWLQAGGALALLAVALGLLRANARAERERTWSAMARELAHQMGTPLSSLAGWAELLELSVEEREQLASTTRIGSEIRADLERLERVSRRFELIGKPPALDLVAVEAALDELERYLAPRLPRLGAGVRLRVRAASELPPIRANRVLLVWALENLVKNALDALAGRGGRIHVAATRAGGDEVRFFVSDTGGGIAPRIRDRLFSPGFTTKAGGWGVGLSLTRRIIEDVHDGTISVRARRGGGTMFELRLPAVDRPADGATSEPEGTASSV